MATDTIRNVQCYHKKRLTISENIDKKNRECVKIGHDRFHGKIIHLLTCPDSLEKFNLVFILERFAYA